MQRTQPDCLRDIIYGLTQASGGASQLIHQMRDPRFIFIREVIDNTRELCIKLAPRNLTVAKEEPSKTLVM